MPEVFQEKTLAVKELAGKGFALGHVAVRLVPHAAREMPAAVFFGFLHFREELRVDFLGPLVILHAALGETEPRIFPAVVDRVAEGGRAFFVPGLFLAPFPGQVDVRLADGIDLQVAGL